MLTLYRRQIYHDRRRMAVTLVLTLMAGTIDTGLLPDPLPVPTELLLALGVQALMPLFAGRHAAQRHWVEIIALGNVILTLSGQLFRSGIFGGHNVPVMIGVQIPVFAALLLGLNKLIFGHWSDNLARRRRYRVHATLRTQLALAELWYGMVPTPGFADRNPDRDVVSIEFSDPGKRAVRLTTWTPPRPGTGEVLLDFHEIIALKHARFHLRILRGRHDACLEGETEMVFEDRGHHRVVHLRHEVQGITPRRAILGYFDDSFGRMMTARLNAIETRVATGRPAKAETGFNAWFDTGGRVEAEHDIDISGYRTAYGRQRSAEETKALRALGRV